MLRIRLMFTLLATRVRDWRTHRLVRQLRAQGLEVVDPRYLALVDRGLEEMWEYVSKSGHLNTTRGRTPKARKRLMKHIAGTYFALTHARSEAPQ